MRATERIRLEPPPIVEYDALGEAEPEQLAQPIIARAVRRDRGGREGVFEDAMAGEWSTRFEIRRTPMLQSINEQWVLRARDGAASADPADWPPYDVEAVAIAAARHNKFYWVYATRRSSRGG